MKTKQLIVGAALFAGAAIGGVGGAATASADVTQPPASLQAFSGTQGGELPEWRRFRYALPTDVELPEWRRYRGALPSNVDLPEKPSRKQSFLPGLLDDLPEPRLRRSLPSLIELPEQPEGRTALPSDMSDNVPSGQTGALFAPSPQKRKRG